MKTHRGLIGPISGSLLLAAAISSADAALVALNLNGVLPGGGTVIGTVSFDSTAADTQPDGNHGSYIIAAWDVTVTPAAPDPGFHFASGIAGHGGQLGRHDQGGLQWIDINLDAFAGNVDTRIQLNFYDLTSPPSPNIAPDLSDFGGFISETFFSIYSISSDYEQRDFLNPDPGGEVRLRIESMTIPEPSSALLAFLAGLAAIGLRRRRS